MLIAFMGLPSSGKSSTAAELGSLLGGQVFLEPEEHLWPDLVKTRAITGRFTALTWFRSVRVPGLFAAAAIRDAKGTAVVDSYYDKLLHLYLGSESFSWLMATTDPYFIAAREMAQSDFDLLPCADVIVFLKLSEVIWSRLMHERGRDYDVQAELHRHYRMQDEMENATRRACELQGMRLLVVEQQYSTPRETALRIAAELG